MLLADQQEEKNCKSEIFFNCVNSRNVRMSFFCWSFKLFWEKKEKSWKYLKILKMKSLASVEGWKLATSPLELFSNSSVCFSQSFVNHSVFSLPMCYGSRELNTIWITENIKKQMGIFWIDLRRSLLSNLQIKVNLGWYFADIWMKFMKAIIQCSIRVCTINWFTREISVSEFVWVLLSRI